jgi:hypothetical protein
MESNTRKKFSKVAPHLLSIAVGVVLGYFIFNNNKKVEYRESVKVEYQDRIEYRDKIVEKIVYQKDSSKQQKVRIVTKYIEKPDGTKETTKEEVIDTNEQETVASQTDKTRDTEIKREVVIQKEVQIEKVETPVMNNWHISASAGLTTEGQPLYGAQVDRRVLGPFYLGARADTGASASVVLGVDF